METFFIESLGVAPFYYQWIVLPLMIFFARIGDVSLATMRIMLLMSGRRQIAPLLGFLEALIWIVAIGQIIRSVNSPLAYVAYAAGFGMGTYVGMWIEGRLALGKVIVRVITRRDATELIKVLMQSRFGFTNIVAEGRKGNVNVIFSVVKRKDLPELVQLIETYNPNAFYTIENVRYASDGGLMMIENENKKAFSPLTEVKK
ncbi:MAG: DUF2179 domain-containing protein [Cytophagales bacterium]|nr:DUF2179 domain-containing protein [Bernardetiaceae bacterium]MDW8203602.1 DUF2179 domain-containing protein [Cytophagales bacterium]